MLSLRLGTSRRGRALAVAAAASILAVQAGGLSAARADEVWPAGTLGSVGCPDSIRGVSFDSIELRGNDTVYNFHFEGNRFERYVTSALVGSNASPVLAEVDRVEHTPGKLNGWVRGSVVIPPGVSRKYDVVLRIAYLGQEPQMCTLALHDPFTFEFLWSTMGSTKASDPLKATLWSCNPTRVGSVPAWVFWSETEADRIWLQSIYRDKVKWQDLMLGTIVAYATTATWTAAQAELSDTAEAAAAVGQMLVSAMAGQSWLEWGTGAVKATLGYSDWMELIPTPDLLSSAADGMAYRVAVGTFDERRGCRR